MTIQRTTGKTLMMMGIVSVLALAGCKSQQPVVEKVISYPGNDVDAQEKALSGFLSKQGIPFSRDGAHLVINLPETITFPSGSAALKSEGNAVIAQIAKVLAQYNQSTVTVIGHTDSTGSVELNNRLSVQRAESVANIMQANGVGDFRLKALGAGSSKPIASNDTAEGKAKNRRVDIVLSPLQLKR